MSYIQSLQASVPIQLPQIQDMDEKKKREINARIDQVFDLYNQEDAFKNTIYKKISERMHQPLTDERMGKLKSLLKDYAQKAIHAWETKSESDAKEAREAANMIKEAFGKAGWIIAGIVSNGCSDDKDSINDAISDVFNILPEEIFHQAYPDVTPKTKDEIQTKIDESYREWTGETPLELFTKVMLFNSSHESELKPEHSTPFSYDRWRLLENIFPGIKAWHEKVYSEASAMNLTTKKISSSKIVA